MEINDFVSLTPTVEIDPTTAQSRATAPGRDDFLKMLLAQLENQDPLNPQDATEFTAQLATFSMLEQLVQISAGIGRLESTLASPAATSTTAVEPVS